MVSILDAHRQNKFESNIEIEVIISNKTNAEGIIHAKQMGYPVEIIPHINYNSREDHEREIIKLLEDRNIQLIVLAGYMRILSKYFVSNYQNKILNIHPSLLPSFPGLHAQRQAFEYGVKYTGVTVHFVNEEVDQGIIIMQEVLEIYPAETIEQLTLRMLEVEHHIYPKAIDLICSGKYSINGRILQRND